MLPNNRVAKFAAMGYYSSYGLQLMLLLLLLLLLLAVVASAAVRGGAIPLLACAQTRVLALSSPRIELCFYFRIGFCGVL